MVLLRLLHGELGDASLRGLLLCVDDLLSDLLNLPELTTLIMILLKPGLIHGCSLWDLSLLIHGELR